MAAQALLPAGVQVFERGWLSSNNILLCDDASTTLVDSGYATHAAQTLALVEQALGGRVLDQLLNTHLHSDHCGGNAALQTRYPALHTRIPPGLAEPVRNWSDADLSYQPTGQTCPPFAITGLLQPGSIHRWANSEWEVHAAPGHDPHSVILFNPEHRVLISADALWENGFGVVFPELEGEPGFDDVAASLDLIERLDPHTIIPGHGPVLPTLQGHCSAHDKNLRLLHARPTNIRATVPKCCSSSSCRSSDASPGPTFCAGRQGCLICTPCTRTMAEEVSCRNGWSRCWPIWYAPAHWPMTARRSRMWRTEKTKGLLNGFSRPFEHGAG